MLVSEKYLSKLQNETKFMKIGHTMPELQPFTFHEKFVAHPVHELLNDTFYPVGIPLWYGVHGASCLGLGAPHPILAQ